MGGFEHVNTHQSSRAREHGLAIASTAVVWRLSGGCAPAPAPDCIEANTVWSWLVGQKYQLPLQPAWGGGYLRGAGLARLLNNPPSPSHLLTHIWESLVRTPLPGFFFLIKIITTQFVSTSWLANDLTLKSVKFCFCFCSHFSQIVKGAGSLSTMSWYNGNLLNFVAPHSLSDTNYICHRSLVYEEH